MVKERLPVSEMSDMLRYWVWLSLVFEAGSSEIFNVLLQFADPKDAYEGISGRSFRELPRKARENLKKHTLDEADAMVEYCRKNDIALLPINCAEYPSVLSTVYAAPILLTAKGNISLLSVPRCVTFVGTRKPSPYSVHVTETLIRDLSAQQPCVIASGFAKGIDAAAHKAAADCGSGTIAVLGCGVNVEYPRENAMLRSRLLSEGNGVMISEYMPGVQPATANFPKRNRILSGLSYMTVVVEAAERSGSLITAQCALNQGRTVFCVPPADLTSERYSGQTGLLRDGASLLLSAEDLSNEFEHRVFCYQDTMQQHIRQRQLLLFADDSGYISPINMAMLMQPVGTPEGVLQMLKAERRALDEQIAAAQKAAAQKDAAESASADVQDTPAEEDDDSALLWEDADLPETEEGRAVYEYLVQHGDTYADDIADALDLNLSDLLEILTELELDGFAETLFGKQYRACER